MQILEAEGDEISIIWRPMFIIHGRKSKLSCAKANSLLLSARVVQVMVVDRLGSL